MKLIYANATDVYVWLGQEADDSDRAMDFIAKKGAKKLRPRGPGYYPIWTSKDLRVRRSSNCASDDTGDECGLSKRSSAPRDSQSGAGRIDLNGACLRVCI
jgi:hypothetical protein